MVFNYLPLFCKTSVIRLYSCVSEKWIDNGSFCHQAIQRTWQGAIDLLCTSSYRTYNSHSIVLNFFLLPSHLVTMSRLFTSLSFESWMNPNCRLICRSSVTQIRCNTSVFGSQTQAWSYVKQQTLDEASAKVCLNHKLVVIMFSTKSIKIDVLCLNYNLICFYGANDVPIYCFHQR